MRRIPVFIAAAILLAATLPPLRAKAQDPLPPEPDSGAVVCPPGVYTVQPDDCVPLGPSTYLTELARKGLTVPLRPLPAYSPDPALAQLPYRYFHLNDTTVPV